MTKRKNHPVPGLRSGRWTAALVGIWVLASPGPSARAQALYRPQEAATEPEATAWLKGYADKLYLPGPPRVDITQVESFVKRVYRAGAIYVTVVSFEGEPQGLRISLPHDAVRRRGIFALANVELQKAGFAGGDDTGQEELVVWF